MYPLSMVSETVEDMLQRRDQGRSFKGRGSGNAPQQSGRVLVGMKGRRKDDRWLGLKTKYELSSCGGLVPPLHYSRVTAVRRAHAEATLVLYEDENTKKQDTEFGSTDIGRRIDRLTSAPLFAPVGTFSSRD